MTAKVLLAAIAAACMATPVLAETYSANGIGMGSSATEQMPVREDLVVVHSQTSYDGFKMEDEANPMSGLSGSCFGAVLAEAGAISGSGNCHYSDVDGDMTAVAWTATGMDEAGRTMGTWELLGGTGKWDGASGGGDFNAGVGEDGTYTNEITGEVMLP